VENQNPEFLPQPAFFDLDTIQVVDLQIGDWELPGAPVLQLKLQVAEGLHRVTGFAQIFQARRPEDRPQTTIGIVQGAVVRRDGEREIQLSTEYWVPLSKTNVAPTLSFFSAQFRVNEAWEGQGTFSYDRGEVKDVPVGRMPDLLEEDF
jgi:hypothetical protein